jgi:hypothetical protein
MQRLEMGIGTSIEEFEDAEIDGLIRKLSAVNKLDDHGVNKFLVAASKRRPLSILRMLLERIDRFEWDTLRDVRALPILGFDFGLEGLPQDPDYPQMLREVRDRSLALDRRNGHLIPQLFREMTLRFSTNYLPILDEWMETKEKDKVVAVAYLVREAYPAFVFSQATFVGKLLDIAETIGEECVGMVSSSLRASAISGMRHGIPGEPFPEDILLRDNALAMSESCLHGSARWRFYNSLSSHAKDSIHRKKINDAEFE